MNTPSRALTVLGIETSCDETAAAVVRGSAPGPGAILSDVVFSQIEEHRLFGGVVPEIAARAHVELLDGVIVRCLSDAGLRLADIDAIAATAGPGLIGAVMTGLLTGKALALAAGKPLVCINHLEAHALTARLTAGTQFPFLVLLVSGGHCQFVAAERLGLYQVYGSTIDDAIGEAFDKTAKLLGLGYPGGPAIERLAATGDSKRVPLPRPMLGRENANFSFAGLKTAVVHASRSTDAFSPEDVAASFQRAVVEIVLDRTGFALRRFRIEHPGANPRFVIAGGVAANRALRAALTELCAAERFEIEMPPVPLCTDNAAMVAWAGLERAAAGLFDNLNFAPRARWPLQEQAGLA
ncbi:MAG TPA: tRNA (adenosine(37)-N6)-threonylcarbamoyltransferase complex transferase subunit TsaD [Rhizomicrobium sp.]|jgi:N6-L-threonylcarbamoyladenine synthase|nr:tRNA (adenosine(37)-N6)-threonylcarbamoyltransferase complex transferase subunit TsaD [Rhizomicrobium sp.]